MNEIVTFGRGYKLNKGIEVFVQSSKIVPNTNTVVIAVDIDPLLKEYLVNNNVTVVDGNKLADKHNVNLNISPYTLKVIFFTLYSKHYTKAEKLYMCDFTDVVFQNKDLFSVVDKVDVTYVSGEHQIISNCETNTAWINICYNADIFNLLKNKQILNGGTILGYRDACVYLLEEMCKDIGCILGRIGNYQNVDQASLNKCVYFDEHKYCITGKDIVFNCAHQSNAVVGTCGENFTLGCEPYVIHQYDVIKSLEQKIYDKFCTNA